ncbi:LysR substrate-binding domain-containing protein [Mesobacterium pallidum]|uniref:LysR substrate-binding domain-containing protein n=1 Tax=Mesobacterium pallidum TaxID=2872037 RepID=UPI001EE1F1B3|nr:LysR substrate-binding domain-containing protein [Mesobacterium pallidum]
MAIKLTHIRDVIAAAETGSLRGASRKLGIAQPAISRSIREVESDLGATLFERHQRGIRLTAIGQAFLGRARLVESELRRAREEVNQLQGELTGQISVAMSAVSTFVMMPTAVQTFSRKYPDAVVKVTESFFQEAEAALASGQIDFYVGPYQPPGSHSPFVHEKLYDQVRVVIARKGHPLANASRLSDLVDAGWVKQTLSERASEADFELSFTKRDLPVPRIKMQTTSATATLLAVANSDLLTIVPVNMLGSPVDTNMFDVVALDQHLTAPPICLVRRADLPLTPMAEYFADMVRRVGLRQDQKAKTLTASPKSVTAGLQD